MHANMFLCVTSNILVNVPGHVSSEKHMNVVNRCVQGDGEVQRLVWGRSIADM